jgi:citrate lyase subunit beta / citryl-CoA lyase
VNAQKLRTGLAAARSFLFVPGDRPGRFVRAEESGADVVIFDLEDAVGSSSKEDALAHVAAYLRQPEGLPARIVRINDPGTARGLDDLAALAAVEASFGVMVPKATPESVSRARDLAGCLVVPLIETAEGVLAAADVAASAHVVRLAFGAQDLAAQLGLDPEQRERLGPARFALTVASAAAGLPRPVDGPCVRLRDHKCLQTDVVSALADGFSALLCLHPDQIPVVHASLAPAPADLAWARRVLEADGDGVAVVDGTMVDAPIRRRAAELVARAGSNLNGDAAPAAHRAQVSHP